MIWTPYNCFNITAKLMLCQHFPCQNSETTDLAKFYAAGFVLYVCMPRKSECFIREI